MQNRLGMTGPGVDSSGVEYSGMVRVGFGSVTVGCKLQYRLNFNQIKYINVHI